MFNVMHDTEGTVSATDGLDPEDIAYKIPQAAKVLNLSDRMVWRMVHSGELPSIKIATSRRVTRQALLDFIEARQRDAGKGVA